MPPSRAPKQPKASPENKIFSCGQYDTMVSGQLFRTETERVAFFHCNRIVGNAVKPFYHIERFGISYDFYLRISTFYGSNRCGVIGFHVVDNKVIDRAAIQNLLDIVEIGFGTTTFSSTIK